jgi:ABC-type lipoprotein export system ATPase subunit
VHALVDGHLELWRGEVRALCDDTGTGKSTLLNALMRLIVEKHLPGTRLVSIVIESLRTTSA